MQKIYLYMSLRIYFARFVDRENGSMDTLDEIKYYCKEANPAGALLLTGQWGCGKTYFVKNYVSKELEYTHIVLHISLFGMASTEEVRNEVKKTWVDTWIENQTSVSNATEKAGTLVKQGGKVLNIFKGFGSVARQISEVSRNVLSINPLDFVSITNKINEKDVILVFDDLERSRVPVDELLGCINEYCENQHFHTVIIANEPEVSSSDDAKIPYSKMKEKIIQRTIPYMSDYQAIISSVINQLAAEYQKDDNRYGEFLQSNSENISMLFSGHQFDDSSSVTMNFGKQGYSVEEIIDKENKERLDDKEKPHNIRSLKVALQDFRRVFDILTANDMEHKEQWLFSFIAYVLCYRAGYLTFSNDENKEKVDPDKYVEDLYIGYCDQRYMTNALRKWIREGEWDKGALKKDIDYIKNQDKAILPEDKARLYRITELEDSDFKTGFPKLLRNAYEGNISLDDYVNLIWNSCWARNNNIKLDIDWKNINEGIRKHINKMLESREVDQDDRKVIGEENKKHFIKAELDAYAIIKEFREDNRLEISNNITMYINEMHKAPLNVFVEFQNKNIPIFDDKMANATFETFENLSNAGRQKFVHGFKRMWERSVIAPDFQIVNSLEGFKSLIRLLQDFSINCEKQDLQITDLHTRDFIDVIQKLINNYDKI